MTYVRISSPLFGHEHPTFVDPQQPSVTSWGLLRAGAPGPERLGSLQALTIIQGGDGLVGENYLLL